MSYTQRQDKLICLGAEKLALRVIELEESARLALELALSLIKAKEGGMSPHDLEVMTGIESGLCKELGLLSYEPQRSTFWPEAEESN